jgi:hypothetical protein
MMKEDKVRSQRAAILWGLGAAVGSLLVGFALLNRGPHQLTLGKDKNVSRLDYSTGSNPLGLAIADLDGDGKPDLAVAIYDNGNGDHIDVFRNTSSPEHLSFEQPIHLPTGRGPEGVAVGDLFGKGRIDLAVANAGDGSLSLLENNSKPGTIVFSSARAIAIGGTPHYVVVADFDGDGKADVVISNNSARMISILVNPLSGQRVDLNAPSYLNQFVLADVDGDGKLDVLVPVKDTSSLFVYRNASQPGVVTVMGPFTFRTDSTPEGIAAGDLFGRGMVDVILANDQAQTTSVFANESRNGEVLFSRTDAALSGGPAAVVIGDVIGNGRPGVVIANGAGDSLAVLQAKVDGGKYSLAPVAEFPSAKRPIALALADLDGDNTLDLVVANHDNRSISVFPNIALAVSNADRGRGSTDSIAGIVRRKGALSFLLRAFASCY